MQKKQHKTGKIEENQGLTTRVDDIEVFADSRIARVSKLISAGVDTTAAPPLAALGHE